MKKAIKHKVRKYIIKPFTCLCGIVFLCTLAVADADQMWIPVVAMIVSGGWLALYAWANGMFYKGEEK